MQSISIKKLFLIDSIGALVTALLTGFILPVFTTEMGIAEIPLRLLSAIAFCYSIYSILCYISQAAHNGRFLTVIAIMNILYAAFSIALLALHSNSVTILGWLYFSGEALILFTLAYVELKKAYK